MRLTITLRSEEFGEEDFRYGSLDEALEGFKHLWGAILAQQDDIERTLSITLKPSPVLHRATSCRGLQ